MSITAAIRRLKSDRGADRAAARALKLDKRLERLEQQEKAALDAIDARKKATKRRFAARRAKIEAVHTPLYRRLLEFANDRRGDRRAYVIPEGHKLEVFTSYKVVAAEGDDQAAIREMEEKGFGEFIRRRPAPPPEVDRASLRQTDNRHVIEEVESLSLEPRQTLKITPPA